MLNVFRNELLNMDGSSYHFGLAPTVRSTFKAILLCRLQYSTERATIRLPRNMTLVSLMYALHTFDVSITPNRGNSRMGRRLDAARGKASVIQYRATTTMT